ncbi:hypothetical protein SAMN05428950_1077 [Sphingomonas sp. OV641]|nr:hypothetical protein SAMN05428950_1077 [Sphingomonas sp. OV641]
MNRYSPPFMTLKVCTPSMRLVIVARETAQRGAGLDADRFDRGFHSPRHPGHGALENGRVLGILFQKADELAIFTDRAEAQGRDIDQQEILVAALVFGEKPLPRHANDLDRHTARSRYRIGVNISGR